MKRIFLASLFTMLIITACKKKKIAEELPETPLSADSIVISNNSDVVTVDIHPDTVLHPVYQTEVHFPLDLNADGTPDFNINYYVTYTGGATMVHNFTKISIETLSTDSYVLCDSVYPKRVFHKDTLIVQSSIHSIYPKVLSDKDVIYKNGNWRTGKLSLLHGYHEYNYLPSNPIPVLVSDIYEGAWYMVDKRYVGLRCKDKLGWIKIGIDKGTIKIYEYASSKN